MKQLILFIWLLALPSSLLANQCAICGRDSAKLYAIRDMAGNARQMVCPRCYLRWPRCSVCGLPLKKGEFTELSDGRLLCNEDNAHGIFTQDELDRVFHETRQELTRTFYRFSMTFPETNVTASVVSADRMRELVTSYNLVIGEIQGLTVPKFFDKKGRTIPDKAIIRGGVKPARMEYHIYVLSGLPRSRMIAVCAHEYGHVWHFENFLDRSLKLERKTREAFCELLAYQLMSAMNEEFEKAVIEANLYTFGQIGLLVETEKEYGFNRILEWMKNGVDTQLSAEDLDRIRAVNEAAPATAAPSAQASSPTFVAPAPVVVPKTLMLKGIMGTGKHKMVLINNQNFELSETANVKVADTKVLVQVVEIRDKSVMVKTNGATQPVELFLQ